MPPLATELIQLLTDRQRMREFVFEDKCVPWRFRMLIKRRFLVPYRLLRYGRVNINTPDRWDKLWDAEGLGTWRRYPVRFARITEIVPARARVLDVGCGVGVLLEQLRREKQCDVLGMDISLSAVRSMHRLGINGLVASAPCLPLATASLDALTATELIEHLDDPRRAIGEFARCLRPGGLLIVTAPNDSLPPWQQDQHMHCFTPVTLAALVRDLFDEVKVEVIQDTLHRETGEVREQCLLLHGRKVAL